MFWQYCMFGGNDLECDVTMPKYVNADPESNTDNDRTSSKTKFLD